jgi:hypothetical protein
MEPKSIEYKSGYKYQLMNTYIVRLPFKVNNAGASLGPFAPVIFNNDLYIFAGYAWDGPSGPTIDTRNFMRGSLIHDALYQLKRQGQITLIRRKQIDSLLRINCMEDGMSFGRAWWVYHGVRTFGASAASKSTLKKTLLAP